MTPTPTPEMIATASGGADLFFGCMCVLSWLLGGFALWLLGSRWWKQRKHIDELQTSLQLAQRQLALARQNAWADFRQQWLRTPPNTFRNEVEVEVKFIYPLVRFLGYRDEHIALRYWVTVQVGRKQLRAEADWVLFRNGKPYIVIEAKEPNVDPAKPEVIEQARSYAFALGAPYYLCTNGRTFLLFQRGVEGDRLILRGTAADLLQHWSTLAQHLANHPQHRPLMSRTD